MKEVYDFCMKVDWDENAISKYASELGLTYEELTQELLIYLKKKVDINTYNQINEKLNNNKTDDEYFELDVFNPILLNMLGVRTYRIWRNKEEKELVLESIYQTWLENNKNIELIMNGFGTSKENILSLLKMYAIQVLELDEEKWLELVAEDNIMEKYDNANGVSKLFTVYEGLINAKSLEDVIKVVNDSGSTTTYLRSHVHDYLIKYRRDDYDEYMALIKSKIKMYSENKKMQRKESDKLQKEETHKKYVDSMLPNANKLIKMFINSSCFTVSEFVNNSSINVNTKLSFNDIFNKCLELVKEYNKELYNEYLDKLEKEKINFYNLHIDNIYTMLSLLKNGIDENGMKRSFDLIDYFGVTSLSLNDTLKFARELYEKKNITSKDYSLFSRFTAQNKNGDYESRKDISTIYAETIKVNVIRNNENGVSNTLETITNETKEKLIEYLRNANIPVNYLTYMALLNRYKMGYLLLEDYKAY